MRTLTDRVGDTPVQEPDRGDRRSVAVVGAGITGLVAAYELRRRGVNVMLYEASGHAGGAIRTTRIDGFLAEHGPNSFMTSPAVDALLSQLELHGEVVEANTTAARRFVVRGGAPVPLPLSPPAMLRTSLFSLRAKARLLAEPFVKPLMTDADESVASFVRRRLGREALDYAVDPFVSGVYAGDPEALSMAHAFPRLFRLERAHGSLVRGMLAMQRARKARGTAETHRPRLVSFAGGMGTLVGALESSLVGTLRLGCPVRLLQTRESRWEIDSGQEGAARANAVDAVVLAIPTHVMAAMELPAVLRRHAGALESVHYPPVSVLTLGFRREDVAHALDGFGMLVPAVEGRRTLGVLFNSTLFPDRAPEGHVTLTCFVGGARQADVAREGTTTLVRTVMADLQGLLGVRGQPVFVRHVFWPRAIPQYDVGYGEVKAAADAMELANAGLYLAGSYRTGVAVGDCVAGGQLVAERVAAYLARAG